MRGVVFFLHSYLSTLGSLLRTTKKAIYMPLVTCTYAVYVSVHLSHRFYLYLICCS